MISEGAVCAASHRRFKIETNRKIQLICEAAQERKAEDIVVMEMGKKTSLCEYFVVMSAPSTVRVKAIIDNIEERLEAKGLRARHKEGLNEAMWVLMDYGDVLVHVFYHETRRFYALENLWGDAPKYPFLNKDS